MQNHAHGRAAAALVAIVLASCGAERSGSASGHNGPPPQVGVLVVRPERVTLTTELSGRTSAFLISEVRPQVSGVVRARLFTEGGYVRAGQPLYQIDPAIYRANYASARAGLAQAEAAYSSAKLKADRYRDLVAINAVSKQDNDEAQAAARQAAANVQAQRAAVDQAGINLGYTRVNSPISGRIGKSSVTAGALVTADQPTALATVQSLAKVYVDVNQSSAELLKLRRQLGLGQAASAPVSLILEDGSAYPVPGVLAFSDITVDPGTGTVGLRAVFPNPQGVLLPGMYVRARIATADIPSAILTPQRAVSRDAKGGATVFVVGAGRKAERRELVLGQTVGDRWLVVSGLKPGEQVIVEGLQKIQPGAPVKPVLLGAPK